jgi:hypothetical protein
VRWHWLLVRRQCSEPEVRVVASVANEGLIVSADQLGVSKGFENCAVKERRVGSFEAVT